MPMQGKLVVIDGRTYLARYKKGVRELRAMHRRYCAKYRSTIPIHRWLLESGKVYTEIKSLRKRKPRAKNDVCRCRKAKRHEYCAYCGCGQGPWSGEKVCGVCHENGIDGKVIAGTRRVVCSLHAD